ncbi:hypothetical protein IMY05_C4391000100 [Salix suchowensis]|nr:hypothetical protein IMY05_C4391000100 [Salix suchowensis]
MAVPLIPRCRPRSSPLQTMWAAIAFILSSIAIAQVHALALYPRQDASPAISVNGASMVTPGVSSTGPSGSPQGGQQGRRSRCFRHHPLSPYFLTITVTYVRPTYPTAVTLRSSYIPTIPSVVPTPGVSGSTPPESNTSTGLSNGAKITLGVTISVATVAFAALAFFIMRRLRERRAGSSAGVFRREKRAWAPSKITPLRRARVDTKHDGFTYGCRSGIAQCAMRVGSTYISCLDDPTIDAHPEKGNGSLMESTALCARSCTMDRDRGVSPTQRGLGVQPGAFESVYRMCTSIVRRRDWERASDRCNALPM